MTGADVASQLRDTVRDSRISSKLNQGSIQASMELRQHRKQDSYRVERDLPRRPPAWDCEGEQEVRKHIGITSSNEDVESWFLKYMEKEAPFLGVYRKNTESESIIVRFKRNLPSFDGFWHTDDLLSWVDDIEDFFEEVKPPQHLKCKIVWYKMKGLVYYWWKQIQEDRKSHGKEEIISWPRMKKYLLNRFLPSTCSMKCPLVGYGCSQSENGEHNIGHELCQPTPPNGTKASIGAVSILKQADEHEDEGIESDTSEPSLIPTVQTENCHSVVFGRPGVGVLSGHQTWLKENQLNRGLKTEVNPYHGSKGASQEDSQFTTDGHVLIPLFKRVTLPFEKWNKTSLNNLSPYFNGLRNCLLMMNFDPGGIGGVWKANSYVGQQQLKLSEIEAEGSRQPKASDLISILSLEFSMRNHDMMPWKNIWDHGMMSITPGHHDADKLQPKLSAVKASIFQNVGTYFLQNYDVVLEEKAMIVLFKLASFLFDPGGNRECKLSKIDGPAQVLIQAALLHFPRTSMMSNEVALTRLNSNDVDFLLDYITTLKECGHFPFGAPILLHKSSRFLTVLKAQNLELSAGAWNNQSLHYMACLIGVEWLISNKHVQNEAGMYEASVQGQAQQPESHQICKFGPLKFCARICLVMVDDCGLCEACVGNLRSLEGLILSIVSKIEHMTINTFHMSFDPGGKQRFEPKIIEQVVRDKVVIGMGEVFGREVSYAHLSNLLKQQMDEVLETKEKQGTTIGIPKKIDVQDKISANTEYWSLLFDLGILRARIIVSAEACFETKFMAGETPLKDFDPDDKWRNRTKKNGKHGGSLRNLLTDGKGIFHMPNVIITPMGEAAEFDYMLLDQYKAMITKLLINELVTFTFDPGGECQQEVTASVGQGQSEVVITTEKHTWDMLGAKIEQNNVISSVFGICREVDFTSNSIQVKYIYLLLSASDSSITTEVVSFQFDPGGVQRHTAMRNFGNYHPFSFCFLFACTVPLYIAGTELSLTRICSVLEFCTPLIGRIAKGDTLFWCSWQSVSMAHFVQVISLKSCKLSSSRIIHNRKALLNMDRLRDNIFKADEYSELPWNKVGSILLQRIMNPFPTHSLTGITIDYLIFHVVTRNVVMGGGKHESLWVLKFWSRGRINDNKAVVDFLQKCGVICSKISGGLAKEVEQTAKFSQKHSLFATVGFRHYIVLDERWLHNLRSDLSIVCKKDQLKRSLKLFHNLVNGLDPPTAYLILKTFDVDSVPYLSHGTNKTTEIKLEDEFIFVGRDRDDVIIYLFIRG